MRKKIPKKLTAEIQHDIRNLAIEIKIIYFM